MVNRPVRIVLVRPRNPGNIGASARAMANFGLTDLVVVDPYEPVWRETRSAPGAEDIVKNARVVATWEDAVKDCPIVLGTSSFHQRSFEQAVIELPNLHLHLSPSPAAEPLALVFGSERSGMSNEELSRCQAIVRIPTHRNAPSMNLGQAVAIVLYELRHPRQDVVVKVPEVRPAQELETLIHALAELGKEADFPAGYTPTARLGRIRQALQGAVLPSATVRFLLSFARWLRKKTVV
jgi:TrmH family RNA methyltransferase